jgi:hypothetical protein
MRRSTFLTPNLQNPYDVLAQPFNLLTASFLLLAASISYDSTKPKSAFAVLINLVFSSIAFRHNRQLRYVGILYIIGGGLNLSNARNAHGQFNEPLFALGGAIFGAGLLWLTLLLHKAFVYDRLRRTSGEDSSDASAVEDEIGFEMRRAYERKDGEEYAREVVAEMLDRAPPTPIEVQLQVECVESCD